MGFVLNNATLPNPIDLILSQMQKIYPMDYIFVLMLSFSLVIYTMSGFQNIGMRYLCVQVSLTFFNQKINSFLFILYV